MLLQNPQLAYALLQAQVVMKIVDPETAVTMLHKPTAPRPQWAVDTLGVGQDLQIRPPNFQTLDHPSLGPEETLEWTCPEWTCTDLLRT